MNRILFPIIAVFLILFFSGCSQHIIKTANSLRVNGELRYAPISHHCRAVLSNGFRMEKPFFLMIQANFR